MYTVKQQFSPRYNRLLINDQRQLTNQPTTTTQGQIYGPLAFSFFPLLGLARVGFAWPGTGVENGFCLTRTREREREREACGRVFPPCKCHLRRSSGRSLRSRRFPNATTTTLYLRDFVLLCIIGCKVTLFALQERSLESNPKRLTQLTLPTFCFFVTQVYLAECVHEPCLQLKHVLLTPIPKTRFLQVTQTGIAADESRDKFC